MAGNTGSPLCAELNRIANYGVYPDRDDFLEEQGAANVWAGTSGLGLLGALNYIVDPNRTDNNYKGLTAVCNELAGTTGLSDVDALRTIGHPAEVLLKGTTARSASFFVDAADALTGGYVFLPGITGNYAFAPDSSALDITGDLDLRIYCAPDTWTPAVDTGLINKYGYSDNNRSYSFGWHAIADYSKLVFRISTAGTTANFTATASENVPFLAGQAGWVRTTYQRDTGAGQCEVKFFYSTNGTTWIQLGTAFTAGSPAATFNSTAPLFVGGIGNTTTNTAGFPGKIYRAQVLSGINGTTAFDANFATGMTSQSVTSFTESSTNAATVTITRTTAAIQPNVITNSALNAGSLLPTTVGSSLAADSNDPKFLDHTGTNYVYLPGTITNYLEVPDAAALDITGDIDLRWYGALDDWTPATQNELLAKQTLSNRSYKIAINSTGFVTFQWSADGSTVITATSTVATGVTDGTAKWVRATLDVDNGASGNDVKFFLSDNGTSWTQLGSTVTNAGVTSIYVGTAPVRIGAIPDIGTTPLTGKVYRAQILNGIDGTTVLDVDTSVITTGAATSFTAVTGQTVTINRSTSGRKSVAVTQPTWLFGTDDYMEVNNRYMAHSTSDENYVYLSGVTGNNMTVADSPPLDVTSDIDIQVKVALDDWTPSGTQRLVSKYSTSDNQRSYSLYVTSTGYLEFAWSNNGTTAITKTSTVTPTVTDGGTLWVRATLDVDNGAAGNDVKFYTSTDGTNWTQLGSTVTTAGTTSVYSGSATLFIGDYSQVNQSAKGKFFRAIIKNGIDGTTVLDADASVITLPSQTTFVDRSSNAYTVTINKSGVGTFVSTGNYMYLPGINLNWASTPDAAPLDITGDIDLRIKVALDDWTPASEAIILGKSGPDSYVLNIQPTGILRFQWINSLSTFFFSDSTVATGVADGATKWVRATLDVDNGAVGNTTTFFTSDDGITWTQLGSPVVKVGTTDIRNSTGSLHIGGYTASGTLTSRGKFFRAQVLNGIGGTVAFDANFENSITSLLQTSFTESSTNGATVTINRSGSTYRSAGVIDAGYLYPGATNTFALSTTDFLNFGATQSFTLFFAGRQWATPASFGNYLNKKDNATNQGSGYRFGAYGTGLQTFGSIADGTNVNPDRFAAIYTAGTLLNTYGVADRNAQTFTVTQNSNSSATASLTGFGAISSPFNFSIGRSSQGTGYQDFELVGAAVFRTALTPKNISDINNYFQGRD